MGQNYGGDYDPYTGQDTSGDPGWQSQGGGGILIDTGSDAGYPTGGASQPSILAQYGDNTGASFGILSGVPPSASDALLQYVQAYWGFIGYPSGFDVNAALASLYSSGQYQSPMQAYDWLFHSTYTTDAQRDKNPGAMFGMNQDDYTATVDRIQGTFFDALGQQVPDDIVKRAVHENWTPTEITNFLEFGDPAGQKGGALSPYLQQAPWLSVGQTYKQVRESYYSQLGQMPADTGALGAWWNFRRGAQSIGGGVPASLAPAPAPSRQLADVEVR